jgi:hypothetical protein
MSLAVTKKKASEQYLAQASYYWRYYSGPGFKFEQLQKDPMMQMASAILMHKVDRASQFLSICKKYIPANLLLNAPLTVSVDGDPSKVSVFTNFKFVPDVSYIDNVNYWVYKHQTIKPILDQYKKDMADAKAKNRWSTVNRGFKYLRKKEVMGISRWATRYLLLAQAGWSDDKIRDVSKQIEVDMSPPDIIICEKPEDYFRMFQVKASYSCMYNDPNGKFNHHGESARVLWEELKKVGMFPSLWYHYNPHMVGVFSVVNGTPRARSFLIRPDLSKDEVFHSGLYSETPSHAAQLENELRKRGYKRGGFGHPITQNFRVPGVDSSAGIVCPLPHCDDVKKPMYVRYHKDSKEFEFSGQETKGFVSISSTYDHAGYVKASRVCSK